MSIEVTGNNRPGKPALAVVATAALLALTLAGAAWLTKERTRPIFLGAVGGVARVPGLQIAWPEGWRPVPLPSRRGPIVAAVSDQNADGGAEQILALLRIQASDGPVRPDQAARLLWEAVARHMRFAAAIPEARSRTTMAGQPAFQIRYAVVHQGKPRWVVIRANSESTGRVLGLMLLSPQQITPADERLIDAVGESMQFGQTEAAPDESRFEGPEADEDEPVRHPQPI